MFTVTDPARPWLVLFSAPTIAEVAEALGAQPERWNLEVTFQQDGFARPLRPEERAELMERAESSRPPGDVVGTRRSRGS